MRAIAMLELLAKDSECQFWTLQIVCLGKMIVSFFSSFVSLFSFYGCLDIADGTICGSK